MARVLSADARAELEGRREQLQLELRLVEPSCGRTSVGPFFSGGVRCPSRGQGSARHTRTLR